MQAVHEHRRSGRLWVFRPGLAMRLGVQNLRHVFHRHERLSRRHRPHARVAQQILIERQRMARPERNHDSPYREIFPQRPVLLREVRLRLKIGKPGSKNGPGLSSAKTTRVRKINAAERTVFMPGNFRLAHPAHHAARITPVQSAPHRIAATKQQDRRINRARSSQGVKLTCVIQQRRGDNVLLMRHPWTKKFPRTQSRAQSHA